MLTSDAGVIHVLAAASPRTILEYDKEYGNLFPLPPITHDGIEVVIPEKASVIHYYHQHKHKWLELQGAD